MFENILFQENTCAELSRDIAALPPSILIYGGALSGKTTLALELARVLTCQNTAALGKWTCACWSCKQQRKLSQNQVLVMGNSNFHREIKICRKFFDQALKNKYGSKQLRFLLLVWLRSLNKVLKRYDGALWKEGKSKTDKERRAQKAQEEFVELLAKLQPNDVFSGEETEAIFKGPKASTQALKKDLDRCEELAEILIAAIPLGIPIQQIRQLHNWSHQTSETRKIAILENVDTINIPAANAMLKLLEEPPHNCYFILTTRKKQALLPTVLSRLRHFALRERSKAEEQSIVQKVFRTTSDETLKELFLTGEQDFSAMQEVCQLFLRALREKRAFFVLKSSLDKLDLESFLFNLGFVLQKECLEQQHNSSEQHLIENNFFWYQKFLQLGRKAMERHKIYHEPAMLLLQNIYLELAGENTSAPNIITPNIGKKALGTN